MDKFDVIKLLSDETRFSIFKTLLDFDRLCVSEIENLLGIKQANTSKHLRKLKDFDVVESVREKNTIFYNVKDQFLTDNEELIRYLLV
ncbi:ArsR/SmtB family transcription factor [Candidatus Xianfuyuplasma coldseepsis]|uniref:Winged helix-turn-helix transcriptional regulator n=1 Tax=Candidatus Xianfuyuplasma coldseepsis TaxID=2782163 RepID=A0A7L7KQS4_9MOLU|nr:metalloregulator ArsR/SmtB family transcription factor [Xianfuyuplasma coldseepsis]QMS85027.1 winged helix-turn-helix transcriptional regulator [Xianfuyuplasma coldseepsis]